MSEQIQQDESGVTIQLNNAQVIAVYDGLQLLCSKLFADAGLNIGGPMIAAKLVVQLHPAVANILTNLEKKKAAQ
jgi:hypothetical protein